MENKDSLKTLFNLSHYPISEVIQRKELNVQNINQNIVIYLHLVIKVTIFMRLLLLQ